MIGQGLQALRQQLQGESNVPSPPDSSSSINHLPQLPSRQSVLRRLHPVMMPSLPISLPLPGPTFFLQRTRQRTRRAHFTSSCVRLTPSANNVGVVKSRPGRGKQQLMHIVSRQQGMGQYLQNNIIPSSSEVRPACNSTSSSIKYIDLVDSDSDSASIVPKSSIAPSIDIENDLLSLQHLLGEKEWLEELISVFRIPVASSSPVRYQEPVATPFFDEPLKTPYSGIPTWHKFETGFQEYIIERTQSIDEDVEFNSRNAECDTVRAEFNFSNILLGARLPGINDCILWALTPHAIVHNSDLLKNVDPSNFPSALRRHLSIRFLANREEYEYIYAKLLGKCRSPLEIARYGLVTQSSSMDPKLWSYVNEELYILLCVLQCNVAFFRVFEDTDRFYLIPTWGLYTYSSNWIPIIEGHQHFHAAGVPVVNRKEFDELIETYYHDRQNYSLFVQQDYDFVIRIREWWASYNEQINSSTYALPGKNTYRQVIEDNDKNEDDEETFG